MQRQAKYVILYPKIRPAFGAIIVGRIEKLWLFFGYNNCKLSLFQTMFRIVLKTSRSAHLIQLG